MNMKLLIAVVFGAGMLALAGCATVSTGYEGTGGLPEQSIDRRRRRRRLRRRRRPTNRPLRHPHPPPPPELLIQALAWEDGSAERAGWSAELRTQIANNLTSLSKASDMASFCPAYASLSKDQKVEVLANLMVGIARYESNYDPHTVYHEPPPLGVDSVGLFQLSYEDGYSWCTLDRNARSLEDPVNNIRCAVPKMTRLVAKDKVLAAGSTNANALGLARYWSVMRLGPGHHIADIRAITTGMAVCAG
ncbi:MAG: transglycosylase SLT domain-containing protein [Asticcacaulis sp.]